MTWGGEPLVRLHNWWHNAAKHKASVKKAENPVRIGILSAAKINHDAIFDPVSSQSEVVVSAIAARSLARAEAHIAQYRLKNVRAYGSYNELLSDVDIDVVYIPLPNGLHCEWSVKAMEAGKHVLVEKPLASNAAQVAQIRKVSEATGKVALEALHWRFHPAAHLVKSYTTSGIYGQVKSISTRMGLPQGVLTHDDIRFRYELAGGACMDLTYVFSACCYFASANIENCTFEILEATPRLHPTDKNIDEAMKAVFLIKQNGKSDIHCDIDIDLARPMNHLFGFIPKLWEIIPPLKIDLDGAVISFPNWPGPWVYCRIGIAEKTSEGGLKPEEQVLQCYEGGPQWGHRGARYWTTYRYQLEAFVDAIKAKTDGREVEVPWMSLEESAKLMHLIDLVYEKAALPRRGL